MRRRVPHADEAQDLTQEFFTRLLEKNYLSAATPTRGRFRAFLLTAVQHFLSNEWDKARAQKRGAGQVAVSLDFRSGEARYSLEPADGSTPERLYQRQWVLTLLDHVLARLGEELALAGKSRDFQQLKVFITSEGTPGGYSTAAGELGISEGAEKVAAHRLRRRYRDLLRAEIAQTVAEEGDVDDEIRSLFAVLGPA